MIFTTIWWEMLAMVSVCWGISVFSAWRMVATDDTDCYWYFLWSVTMIFGGMPFMGLMTMTFY